MKLLNAARRTAALAVCLSTAQCLPSACPSQPSGSIPAPSVAPGYQVGLVATGLSTPRSIIMDSKGHLLVVQSGVGVAALELADHGGTCVSVMNNKQLVSNTALNHGIALSQDGRTLYASSMEAVFAWSYDPTTMSVTSGPRTVVNNMTNNDHNTRTLLMSKKKPGTLIINRGSNSNVDPLAAQLSSGHSQIKAFDLTKLGHSPYDFNSNGKLLGWGLRNDVGIAEEPTKGGIYSVENSADQVTRYGIDFHQNNPAEELNYLGTLVNNTSPNQGGNFGYPRCFTAWNASQVPQFDGTAGTPFAFDPQSQYNDSWCLQNTIASRNIFMAHEAPLDILFNEAGSEAWITFHGSWDRTVPVGYKVAKVAFKNGEPVMPSTSMKVAVAIVKNQNRLACPNGCFRPVGLAFGSKRRLFFSSDATGEVYVIQT